MPIPPPTLTWLARYRYNISTSAPMNANAVCGQRTRRWRALFKVIWVGFENRVHLWKPVDTDNDTLFALALVRPQDARFMR